MAKKDKNPKVILDKTELMPTTIGTLETKENGPIVVILIIVFFGLCIIVLPYASTLIQRINDGEVSINKPDTKQPSSDDTTNDTKEEIEYQKLTTSLSFSIDKYTFNNFVLDSSKGTLSFKVTNAGGDVNMFVKNNYYVELFTSDKKLLQRVKMDNKAVSNTETFTLNVSNALKSETAKLIIIRSISKDEYTQVTVSNNKLTCTLGSTTLNYTFKTDENKKYLLTNIEEKITVNSSSSNYEDKLSEYTTRNNTLDKITGVSTDILPTTNGFSYTESIDLGLIDNTNMNKYFKGQEYYALNTEAKVIAFELTASNYNCK